MIVMRNGDEVAVSCALTGRKLENNWVNVAFGQSSGKGKKKRYSNSNQCKRFIKEDLL